MQSTYAHLTLVSKNAKTGPIPVSTTEKRTCPPSCPLYSRCYAGDARTGAGGPLALHWRKVSEHKRGTDWQTFTRAIAALPAGQLWRHNQAGDLAGTGERINAGELRSLVRANSGKRGFTYTHKHTRAENLPLIKAANAAGFTVNLSANSLRHADELAETKAGPVVTLLPADAAAPHTPKTFSTPAGRKVIVCPATYRENVSCATCGLCSHASRSAIVGFPAHGNQARKADEVARTF